MSSTRLYVDSRTSSPPVTRDVGELPRLRLGDVGAVVGVRRETNESSLSHGRCLEREQGFGRVERAQRPARWALRPANFSPVPPAMRSRLSMNVRRMDRERRAVPLDLVGESANATGTGD